MTARARITAILEWAGLGAAAGLLCGVASAVFLIALERATAYRVAHSWLVYLLPVAGLGIGFLYERWGKPIAPGTSLIIDSIHEDTPQIPLRMAPMVLIGTVLTHVFGGSAGREGTAVQMGASLADAVAHRLRVSRERRRQLLAAGIAGGFGSVFGTPIAGTIFGLEVVAIGRMEYDALLPALIASLLGDFVTQRLGVVHTAYPAIGHTSLTLLVAGKLVVIGLAMAGATVAFIELTHTLKKHLAKIRLPLRMALGGAIVVVLWQGLGALSVGSDDYLGLGVPTIVRAFSDPSLPSYAFALKLLFTAITIGAGFLGGEVTPLFFVGATLGSVLARALGLPIELGATVGIAAVFGAAANTPLSLSIMAVELCGANALPHVLIVSAVAYLASGHRSIYPSQLKRGRKGSPDKS